MVSIESVSGGVIIDGRRIRAKTVSGKILKQRGAYYLQLKSKKVQIPLTPLAPESELSALAGRDVNVALSSQPKPSVIAIGTWSTPEQPGVRKIRRIICYIPVPDLRGILNSGMQELVLKNLARR
jgi:hypothetical protein